MLAFVLTVLVRGSVISVRVCGEVVVASAVAGTQPNTVHVYTSVSDVDRQGVARNGVAKAHPTLAASIRVAF